MDNVELLQLAIRRLADEKKNGRASVADDDLLSRLIFQLESLKEDGAIKQPKSSVEPNELHSPAVGEMEVKSMATNEVDAGSAEIGTEEIIKELKKVERQNSITHWLLSIMIVLILGWQLSEFSFILKVKEGLNHPFRSFGNLVIGMLKGPDNNGQDAEKQSSLTKKPQIETPPLPLRIPELPHVDLPVLGLNGEGD
ncbi:hypothetical protein CK203_081913 [Vitis vinifera]|uniref:Uncharacterized protein n=1 Tax=Vitis vinifera TaxID=29760 RepID=A0A438DX24_VITVI|nr:hypothetical protein CK203_081913 [Vitis vinifera]